MLIVSTCCKIIPRVRNTYGLILDLLGLAALERNAVTLVLEALGSDETLDAGCLGVGLLALTLGGDLATNDVLANLVSTDISTQTLPEIWDV